jgi:hypothetical protein
MKLEVLHNKLISIKKKTIHLFLFISFIGTEVSTWYYISNTNENIKDWYYMVAETLFGWLFVFSILIMFLQRHAASTIKNKIVFIISLLFVAALFIGPILFFYIYRADLQ